MAVTSTIVEMPFAGQLAQAADGVGHAIVLVAPFLWVVLLHLGGEHEDVLVHEYLAEAGRPHRAARRLDSPQVRPPGR